MEFEREIFLKHLTKDKKLINIHSISFHKLTQIIDENFEGGYEEYESCCYVFKTFEEVMETLNFRFDYEKGIFYNRNYKPFTKRVHKDQQSLFDNDGEEVK